MDALSQLPFLRSPLISSGLRASCYLLYRVCILSCPFSFEKGWKDSFSKFYLPITLGSFFSEKGGRDNFGRQRGYVCAGFSLLYCVYVATWTPFLLVPSFPFIEINILNPRNSSTPSCLFFCRFFKIIFIHNLP